MVLQRVTSHAKKNIFTFFKIIGLPFYLCGINSKLINYLKQKNSKMKNAFKLGFLALALSLSVAACNSEKKAEGADSSAVDSSIVDSAAAKVDSAAAKVDSAAAKVDSVAKEVKH
jgi:hypothetical protein